MKLELNSETLDHIVGGDWLVKNNQPVKIQQIIIDSRKGCIPETTLFITLQGKRVSGVQFVDELYNKGVRNFIVQENISSSNYPDANILKVKNCITALQEIAKWHRSKFSYPVIAITGSNGKTIVKEWSYALLKKQFTILRSPKSYNSQIGVPLSVLEMTNDYNLALIEVGISMPGEMEKLEAIVQPKIGVFTHLGTSHLENFTNSEALLFEKWKLFSNVQKTITPISLVDKKANIFSWGTNNADLNYSLQEDEITKLFVEENRNHTVLLPKYTDTASVNNLMSCLSLVKVLGISFENIKEEVANLEMPALRLELIEGKNNCQIINDTYSNDLSGLAMALDFQKKQKGFEKYVLILSAMEGAIHNVDFLNKINTLIETANYLNEIVLIGSNIEEFSEISTLDRCTFYVDTEDFIKDKVSWINASILIKGSRRFHFEKITHLYSQVNHETVLKINLEAIRENLNFFKSKLKDSTRIMVMVKAAAYGSGIEKMAQWFHEQNIDALGVAYVSEGVSIREAGIDLPIMVLNVAPNDYRELIDYRLEPAIGSINRLESLIRSLINEGIQNYPIHLEIETGMHRLGFSKKDWSEAIDLLKAQPEVQVSSIFSHFAASDDKAHNHFTNSQIRIFEDAVSFIQNSLPYQPIIHICNSQGILNFPQAHFDMVRLGLGLYGYGNNKLQPAFSMFAKISQIKNVAKGESVSYGRTFIANEDSTIAIIPLGYADGLKKFLSNGKWHFLINGKIAPIIGQICMDMCMVDVSKIKGIKEGDVVQIFGPGNELQDLAEALNTIPYEVITGVSSRIMRVYEE